MMSPDFSACLPYYDPELSPLNSTAVQENQRGGSEVQVIIRAHITCTQFGNQKSKAREGDQIRFGVIALTILPVHSLVFL